MTFMKKFVQYLKDFIQSHMKKIRKFLLISSTILLVFSSTPQKTKACDLSYGVTTITQTSSTVTPLAGLAFSIAGMVINDAIEREVISVKDATAKIPPHGHKPGETIFRKNNSGKIVGVYIADDDGDLKVSYDFSDHGSPYFHSFTVNYKGKTFYIHKHIYDKSGNKTPAEKVEPGELTELFHKMPLANGMIPENFMKKYQNNPLSISILDEKNLDLEFTYENLDISIEKIKDKFVVRITNSDTGFSSEKNIKSTVDLVNNPFIKNKNLQQVWDNAKLTDIILH